MKRLPIWVNIFIGVIIFLGLFNVIAFNLVYNNKPVLTGPATNSKENTAIIENIKNPEPHKTIMHYKIVGPGSGRFDEAKTYTVLIPEAIKTKGLKDSIKAIIDDIAGKENTNKFSVDIYDDKTVTDYIQESEVKKTRIVTKKERGKWEHEIQRHCVAYYNGGLMIDGNPQFEYEYELAFFPYIEEVGRGTPKVKMSETIEYIPNQNK